MEDKPEAHIPHAGVIGHGSHGVIACACGSVGHLIPPKRTQDETVEPYDEREIQP